jgi:Ni/Fe-hydrogenase 1 B-type cytochrome subunit
MFKRKQPLSLRLWHWANAITISALFCTVILRETFLNGKDNKKFLLEKAAEVGAVLSEEQARHLARALMNQMWQWHPIIGFVAIALLLFRGLIYFQHRKSPRTNEDKPLQYKIVKVSHKLFYVFLGYMGISGVMMYWEENLHIPENFVHLLKESHEALLWFFVVFTILHIVGVVKAEQTPEDRGIISDMINGGE